VVCSATRALALWSFGCHAPRPALVQAGILRVLNYTLGGVILSAVRAYSKCEQLAVTHQLFTLSLWSSNQALEVALEIRVPRFEEFNRHPVAYREMFDCCDRHDCLSERGGYTLSPTWGIGGDSGAAAFLRRFAMTQPLTPVNQEAS
jgi:hypothetical protein